MEACIMYQKARIVFFISNFCLIIYFQNKSKIINGPITIVC